MDTNILIERTYALYRYRIHTGYVINATNFGTIETLPMGFDITAISIETNSVENCVIATKCHISDKIMDKNAI